jgi:hypothetical protein
MWQSVYYSLGDVAKQRPILLRVLFKPFKRKAHFGQSRYHFA